MLPLPPRRTRARWTGRVCSTRSPSSGSTRSCPPGTSAASRNPSPVSVNILELETKVAEDSAKFYMVVKSSGTFGKPSLLSTRNIASVQDGHKLLRSVKLTTSMPEKLAQTPATPISSTRELASSPHHSEVCSKNTIVLKHF